MTADVMGKRALVTGITGQDGSYLAELLLSKGYQVFGLVRRLSVPNVSNMATFIDRVTLLDGDLTDSSSLDRAIREAEPDEIYNLGAQSFVGTSFKQPILTGEVSGLGVLRLLEAMRNHVPDARFYQASTSELYGQVRETPQRETTPFHPRSPYGVAKIMGCWATVNYRESYGMHASNGILFNHESPRRGEEFVTRKISLGVAKIHLGLEKTLVLGNLDAKRDWGYAPEYVEGMWRMLQQKEGDDFVLATGETWSVRDFARLAFAEVGIEDWESHVVTDPRHHRPAEVHLLQGDPSKAERALGWKARTRVPELARIMVRADVEALGKRR
ncbi:MAG TPA: GDP-mannose 4,6-dehydratase [Candidatus Thermoplasmatota archaeon]|nr:GDP-mannose 4,6-dehydratase [Candidatus Thermoplasmatota archaeon]